MATKKTIKTRKIKKLSIAATTPTMVKDNKNKKRRTTLEEQANDIGLHLEPWMTHLDRNDKGKVLPTRRNVKLGLTKSNEWQGVLGFDEFSDKVVLMKDAPFEDGLGKAGTAWDGNCEYHARVWFECLPHVVRFSPATEVIGSSVEAVARLNRFHSVRDYFNSLHWDGTPRLERWLIIYLKAEDTPYVRAVGPRWIISAVARTFQPGCKADYELVLEGKQGRQKSLALAALCSNPDWFTDHMPAHGSKDAAMQIKGKLIIEDSELAAMSKSKRSASKAFLTRTTDRFRPPYTRHVIEQPRHCIMAGTVNPSAITGGRYLADETGNRRYWPVPVADDIDIEAIKRDRDQLWAEAVKLYRDGHAWWLETDELEALATVEQAKRMAVNDMHDVVIKWLEALEDTNKYPLDRLPNKDDVSTIDCLNAIYGDGRPHSHANQMKVANIFKHCGYEWYRPHKAGQPRTPRYRIPNSLANSLIPDDETATTATMEDDRVIGS